MKLTVIHRRSLRISGVEIVLFSLLRSVLVVLSTRVSVDPCRSWIRARSDSLLRRIGLNGLVLVELECSRAMMQRSSRRLLFFFFFFLGCFLGFCFFSSTPVLMFGRNGQRFAPPSLMMSVTANFWLLCHWLT